ncbi:MAG: CpsD/CapB family tyrosine-protein kinase [Pseudomonadota bacterium]
MERLKAALDKARASRARTEAGTSLASARGGGRQRANADAVAAAWRELTQMEVDPQRLRWRRLVALSGGTEAAAFDLLRTKVLQLAAANNWKRIGVTSPLAGSGKTTTSINLAISLARQVDLRVVLMDMDMRRPAVAKAFGRSGTSSVADVLMRHQTFAGNAHRIGENLAIAMNHTRLRDPSDLFLRRSTSEVLREIEETYQPDIMLFDLPPALVNDDAQALLDKLDAVIIVAEAGSSTISQIDVCEKELAEQTSILGIVLNKCRFQSDGYGHYDYDYS